MNRPFTLTQFAASIFIIGALVLGLGPLVWFVISYGGWQNLRFDQNIFSVLLFTLKQAFYSTVISLTLGLWAARALARREFFGKGLLLSVFAVPFALPAIVAVLGATAIYGTRGVLGGWVNIYGLAGILLVHVFFNLPLAIKFFHEILIGISADRFKLAAQLSFTEPQVFWHVEWPMIKASLPGIFSLIFLLCAASFVVVLTLGGPAATTLEVAIFHALRMDFDVPRALALSVLQILLCLVLVGMAGRIGFQQPAQSTNQKNSLRFDGRSLFAHIFDTCAIAIASLIVLPPLVATVIYGAPNINIDVSLLTATGFSLVIGVLAASLALALAWPFASLSQKPAQILALAALIVPPAVMATGWFLAMKKFDNSFFITLTAVITLNGLMALPFVHAVLRARFAMMGASYHKLCAQLGVAGWNKFWKLDVPFMAPALRQAGLLAFIMSLGDLTAVTLLGSQGLVTLPALIHQQMGNYRGNAAAGTALILALGCYGLALIAQRLGKQDD